MISNRQLTDRFLSPQMRAYFERKLPDVPPAEVGVRIEEALKFLNMAAHCRGSIPVNQEIDDVWHLWILETKQYQALCSALTGRTFLHHSSHVYADCADEPPASHDNDLSEDVAMLATYVRNYGPFAPDRVRYWLLAAHLVERCGWPLDELNHWLATGEAPVGEQLVTATG